MIHNSSLFIWPGLLILYIDMIFTFYGYVDLLCVCVVVVFFLPFSTA